MRQTHGWEYTFIHPFLIGVIVIAVVFIDLLTLGTIEVSPSEKLLQSTYTSIAPTINGDVTTDTWRAAPFIELKARGGARCLFYLLNDEDNLYVGVDAVDDTTNETMSPLREHFDNIAVWFRAGVGYWLYGNGYLRTNRASAAKGAVSGPPVLHI